MAIETFLGEPPANIKQWIIDHAMPVEPTAPNGKVLYKTSAEGEWLESNADTSNGVFTGFNEKESAVAVILPSKDASGNDVMSIGNYAFESCSDLISVTIPYGVMSIGEYAFDWCTSLTSVAIPNSVESIGNGAFVWCTSLTSVAIPNSVESIGEYMFANCTSLTNVTIPNSVTTINISTFSDCESLMSVMIPDSVESIGNDAFRGCNELTNVTMQGKTIAQVQAMNYSNWYLPSGCTIHCTNGDITIQ